jgi:hypothetical protein
MASIGLGRRRLSVQFERLIFFVLEERLRLFSGSASLQGSDSLPRRLIRRRRILSLLRSMESFLINKNFVVG